MTESDEPATHLAREESWRKRLAEAEDRYHAAVVRRRVLAPGAAETEVANANKAAARAEYLRILRIFTDLVLRGKEPGS